MDLHGSVKVKSTVEVKGYAVIMVLCDSALTFLQVIERSARRSRLFTFQTQMANIYCAVTSKNNQNSKKICLAGAKSGRCVRAKHDWFWFYPLLARKVGRIF